VRTGGVGESELERLVSMSSGPELLVRNSSLSLSTSGHGELRGSDDGEEDGKEEVEEEGKEDADAEEEEDDEEEEEEEEASSDSTEAARNALGHSNLVHDPSLCPLVLSLDSTITRPPSQFPFVISDWADCLTCWHGQEGGKDAVEDADTMLTEEEEEHTMLTGSMVCSRLCRRTKLNWVGPGHSAAT